MKKSYPQSNQKNSDRYFLFTPGPVNVDERVRTAIAKEGIGHREEDFSVVLRSIEDKLLQLFEIRESDKYKAVVISGSGTAANEAMISSTIGDKRILILSNGEFGERLFHLSQLHNKNTFLLEFGWGEKFDIKRIENFLKENKFDAIAMIHHETCSGMLNPLEEIGALAKAQNALFLVDCVSSVGAESIDMEKCHISFCSNSGSKAIAAYPGIAFVMGRVDEFEKLKDLPAKTAYLNLAKFYDFAKSYSQTPNTPAVHLFFALEQALENIIEQGVANYRDNIAQRAQVLRAGMKTMGLNFLIDEEDMCSVLTTVNTPSHLGVSELQQKLRDRRIIIYEGKGEFQNKVFQVSNIGDITQDEITFFLDSLQEIIHT